MKRSARCHSTLNMFIRSCLFWLYSTASIVIYSSIVLCLFMLPVRTIHAMVRQFLRLYIYIFSKICCVRYEIEGLENIPVNQNGIVFSKHQSTWETFYLPIAFRYPAYILKKELFYVPFFGWALAVSKPIAIDRKNRSSAMQQVMVKGKKCLEDGRWVIVFPEGTRVAPGEVGHYRLGGARLAAETGYPVIPVAHNAGRVWPRRRFIKRPGVIRVVIGPMIQTKGRTPEEILSQAKDWIETTMLRIDGSLLHKPAGQ